MTMPRPTEMNMKHSIAASTPVLVEFASARKVLLETAGRKLDAPAWAGAPHTLADELLLPSVVYAPAIAALLRVVDVRSIAHVTGGGLPGNLVRVLPDHADAVIDARSWEPSRIFGEIQRLGEVSDDEMRRVFNLGIGMVVVVDPADADSVTTDLEAAGETVHRIGSVEAGEKGCTVTGSADTWSAREPWSATHHG